MKQKKIFLFIFLSIIIYAIVLFPNKAFAGNITITEIHLKGTEIQHGNTIPTTATVDSTAPDDDETTSKTAKITWYESTTSGNIGAPVTTATFQAGKYYYAAFTPDESCSIASGYQTKATTRIYYNDFAMVDGGIHNFQATKAKISELRYTMNPIKTGKTISNTAVVTSVPEIATSASTGLCWYRSNDGSESTNELSGSMIAPDQKFTDGKYYYWTVTAPYNTQDYYIDETTAIYLNDEEINFANRTWVKAEKSPVNSLSITGVDEPVIGNKVNNQTTLPTVTVTPNITTGTDGGWRKAQASFDINHELTKEYIQNNSTSISPSSNSNFEEGIYILLLGTHFENDVKPDANFKVTINGKEVDYEFMNDHQMYEYYAIELIQYTYEYISGNNQTLKKGKADSYTFQLDGDDTKFTSFEVDGATYVKDTDYTVSHGSTIITLLPAGIEKINSLAAGTHTTKVTYTLLTNVKTVTGTFVIEEEQTSNSAVSTPAASNPTASETAPEVKDATPKTGTMFMIDYISYSKCVVNIVFLILIIYFISKFKKINNEEEFNRKVNAIFILTFIALPYNLIFETFVPIMCFILSFYIKFNGTNEQSKTTILESNIKKYLITYAVVTFCSTLSDRMMCSCCDSKVVYTLCAMKSVMILVITIVLIAFTELFMKGKKIPTILCVIIICLTLILSFIFDLGYTSNIHNDILDIDSYDSVAEEVINFWNG